MSARARAVEVERQVDARLAGLALHAAVRGARSALLIGGHSESEALREAAIASRNAVVSCLGARRDAQVVRDADVADQDAALEQRLEHRVRVVDAAEQHEVRTSSVRR